ncbi:hypothetical protein BDZ97DRAFT_2063671 [Flammula alnicola]|nr:hypothetical protein BDZ97DRAFT_2063671 [Flammula alnicola]
MVVQAIILGSLVHDHLHPRFPPREVQHLLLPALWPLPHPPTPRHAAAWWASSSPWVLNHQTPKSLHLPLHSLLRRWQPFYGFLKFWLYSAAWHAP